MFCRTIGILARGAKGLAIPGGRRERRHWLDDYKFFCGPHIFLIFFIYQKFGTDVICIALRFKQMLAAKIAERHALAAEKERKEKEEEKGK